MEVLGFKNLGVVLGELGVNTPSFLSLCGTVLGHILGGFSENPQQDWAPFAHNSNLFMNTPLYWLFSLPWFISPLLFFSSNYRKFLLDSVQKRNAQLSKKKKKTTNGYLAYWAGWWCEYRALSPWTQGSAAHQDNKQAWRLDKVIEGAPGPGGLCLGSSILLIIKIQAWRDFKGPCFLASTAAGHEIQSENPRWQIGWWRREDSGWLATSAPTWHAGPWRHSSVGEAGLPWLTGPEPPDLLTCGQLIPASYATARHWRGLWSWERAGYSSLPEVFLELGPESEETREEGDETGLATWGAEALLWLQIAEQEGRECRSALCRALESTPHLHM